MLPSGAGKALDDIAHERARQVAEEGWSPAHDDNHGAGELAAAGAAYAVFASQPQHVRDLAASTSGFQPIYWPRCWGPASFKPKGRRRDLVRAAALLVAEIERLDRIAPRNAHG